MRQASTAGATSTGAVEPRGRGRERTANRGSGDNRQPRGGQGAAAAPGPAGNTGRGGLPSYVVALGEVKSGECVCLARKRPSRGLPWPSRNEVRACRVGPRLPDAGPTPRCMSESSGRSSTIVHLGRQVLRGSEKWQRPCAKPAHTAGAGRSRGKRGRGSGAGAACASKQAVPRRAGRVGGASRGSAPPAAPVASGGSRTAGPRCGICRHGRSGQKAGDARLGG